jgi:hypothetical protein
MKQSYSQLPLLEGMVPRVSLFVVVITKTTTFKLKDYNFYNFKLTSFGTIFQFNYLIFQLKNQISVIKKLNISSLSKKILIKNSAFRYNIRPLA